MIDNRTWANLPKPFTLGRIAQITTQFSFEPFMKCPLCFFTLLSFVNPPLVLYLSIVSQKEDERT